MRKGSPAKDDGLIIIGIGIGVTEAVNLSTKAEWGLLKAFSYRNRISS